MTRQDGTKPAEPLTVRALPRGIGKPVEPVQHPSLTGFLREGGEANLVEPAECQR